MIKTITKNIVHHSPYNHYLSHGRFTLCIVSSGFMCEATPQLLKWGQRQQSKLSFRLYRSTGDTYDVTKTDSHTLWFIYVDRTNDRTLTIVCGRLYNKNNINPSHLVRDVCKSSKWTQKLWTNVGFDLGNLVSKHRLTTNRIRILISE